MTLLENLEETEQFHWVDYISEKTFKMKKILFFLFLATSFASHSQELNADKTPNGPYVQLKNGRQYEVLRPMVVCENTCYYMDRFSRNSHSIPLDSVEGFGERSDVRYMTKQEFKRIGRKPVKGYFFGVLMIYPAGLGIFIFSDITKRRHIRNLYRHSIRR